MHGTSYLFQGVTGPGPTPYPIGHESIGIIRKIGEGVTGFEVGDNVFLGAGSNEMMSQYLNIIAAGAAKLLKRLMTGANGLLNLPAA